MARILGTWGAELRDTSDEGLVIMPLGALSISYPTSPSPANSQSGSHFYYRLGTVFRPWYDGNTASGALRSPSSTRWGFQMQILKFDTDSTGSRAGVGASGAELLTISSGTSGLVQLWLNGAVIATAANTFLSAGTFRRFTVDVNAIAGGWIRVYVDGETLTPVIDFPLSGSIGVPNGFYSRAGLTRIGIDDSIAWEWGVGAEPDDLTWLSEASISLHVPDGPGTYAEWSDGGVGVGTFDLIDETPSDDLDFISASAPDQAATFTVTDTSEPRVLQVTSYARVLRTGTDAGQAFQIRTRDSVSGVDLDYPSTPTGLPSDGHVIVQMDTDANGASWTAAAFNAAEFGPVSRS